MSRYKGRIEADRDFDDLTAPAQQYLLELEEAKEANRIWYEEKIRARRITAFTLATYEWDSKSMPSTVRAVARSPLGGTPGKTGAKPNMKSSGLGNALSPGVHAGKGRISDSLPKLPTVATLRVGQHAVPRRVPSSSAAAGDRATMSISIPASDADQQQGGDPQQPTEGGTGGVDSPDSLAARRKKKREEGSSIPRAARSASSRYGASLQARRSNSGNLPLPGLSPQSALGGGDSSGDPQRHADAHRSPSSLSGGSQGNAGHANASPSGSGTSQHPYVGGVTTGAVMIPPSATLARHTGREQRPLEAEVVMPHAVLSMENQLNLRLGDVVRVTSYDPNAAWWGGELYGRKGIFPARCVAILE
jgi:hypothetical protein